MGKELIERLYEESQNDTESLGWKAADLIEAQQKQLAAAQAQIAELKDFAIWLTGCGYDFTQHPYFIEQRDRLLKKPHDDSALRELLKAERERCAKVCDRKKKEFAEAFKDMADESLGAGQCAAAIRAMGSES